MISQAGIFFSLTRLIRKEKISVVEGQFGPDGNTFGNSNSAIGFRKLGQSAILGVDVDGRREVLYGLESGRLKIVRFNR